jgi:hypothetical protein
MLRWWIAVAAFIIYAFCVDNPYIIYADIFAGVNHWVQTSDYKYGISLTHLLRWWIA